MASFLSNFTSVGYLWTFATTNTYPVDEQFSFVACFSNDFDQLNGLFDDTMNEICHQIHAYTTLNKSFTYLHMLRQEDFKHFFQAMKLNSTTMKLANTGTLWNTKTYCLAQGQ
jgi:hypothetical protein